MYVNMCVCGCMYVHVNVRGRVHVNVRVRVRVHVNVRVCLCCSHVPKMASALTMTLSITKKFSKCVIQLTSSSFSISFIENKYMIERQHITILNNSIA